MSIYQSYPDTFSKPTLYPTQRPVTNERYNTFTQIHFTAGDEEQFLQYCNNTTFRRGDNIPVERTWDFAISDKFRNNSVTTKLDTFRHVFHKFKKGIFIQIKDGKLSVFLPFSNAHFVNEWSAQLEIPPELAASSKVLPAHMWYANNYLVRFENPLREGDTGHAAIKDMFEQLCKTHKVPDIELFVNRRDFPILKNDGTEPYEAIYGSNTPLKSHNYSSFLPILSMVERANYADIAIPTPDDWARVRSSNKKNPPQYFMTSKRSLEPFQDYFHRNWSQKRSMAVFRGSATGSGVTADTNLRMKLFEITRGNPLFNVGITANSDRYQIVNEKKLAKQPVREKGKAARFMSAREQSSFKYVIHAPGHVQAFRLSAELAFESVILLIGDPADHKLWFEKKLEKWEHYVPVKSDLSDLVEKVQWCVDNDEKARGIALNARRFYDSHLGFRGCLQYLYELVCDLRQKVSPRLPIYNLSKRIPALPEPKHLVTCSPILTESRCLLNIVNSFQITEKRLVFSNRTTRICLDDRGRVLKKSRENLVHEAAVGLCCLNDLIRLIPNFAYTYRLISDSLELEYIPGKTMKDYIMSREFIFDDWLGMIKQLALAFYVAQKSCAFTHHDTCPWNIIIYEEISERVFDYPCGERGVYRVRSKRTPVLIDYGRSYAECYQKFGGFEPFKDCLCLLVSSSHLIAKQQKLSSLQQQTLLDLFNTAFANAPRYFPGAGNFDELTQFLDYAHKFSHITSAEKDGLLDKSPLVLFDAIDLPKTSAWTFEAVQAMEHTHAGKIASVYKLPSSLSPLSERYALQRLWLMCVPTSAGERYVTQAKCPKLPEAAYYVKHLRYSEEGVKRGQNLKLKFMLYEILLCGGPFAPSDEEKAIIKSVLVSLR
jgi:hypothetical protein